MLTSAIFFWDSTYSISSSVPPPTISSILPYVQVYHQAHVLPYCRCQHRDRDMASRLGQRPSFHIAARWIRLGSVKLCTKGMGCHQMFVCANGTASMIYQKTLSEFTVSWSVSVESNALKLLISALAYHTGRCLWCRGPSSHQKAATPTQALDSPGLTRPDAHADGGILHAERSRIRRSRGGPPKSAHQCRRRRTGRCCSRCCDLVGYRNSDWKKRGQL